jgi:hypothetical protein
MALWGKKFLIRASNIGARSRTFPSEVFDLKPTSEESRDPVTISDMGSIPELLNGYIGALATPGGLVTFMRVQLDKPVPSPVVLGQISEKFREAIKAQAEPEQQQIPIYKFDHKQRKDDVANNFRKKRRVRDQIVFIGVAQEKAQAYSGIKVNGQFQFNRDKAVYVNHYYFYIDDEDFGPLFIKVCSYAPWGIKLCLNGHEWAKRQLEQRGMNTKNWTMDFSPAASRRSCRRCAIRWGRRTFTGYSGKAAADSVAAGGARPAGRLRLGSVDLADGSESHADLRSSLARQTTECTFNRQTF